VYCMWKRGRVADHRVMAECIRRQRDGERVEVGSRFRSRRAVPTCESGHPLPHHREAGPGALGASRRLVLVERVWGRW
jgi:hypothetical protein